MFHLARNAEADMSEICKRRVLESGRRCQRRDIWEAARVAEAPVELGLGCRAQARYGEQLKFVSYPFHHL